MKEQLKTISYDMEPSEQTALRQKMESIDDILPYVGNFGKYQWYLLFALLPYGLIYANLYFSTFFFTLTPPEYWCYIPELEDLNLTMKERIEIGIPKTNKYPYFDQCHQKDLDFNEIQMNNGNILLQTKLLSNKSIKCDKWEYNSTQIPYQTISSELDWVCDKEHFISSSQAIFFCGSILGSFTLGWVADHHGRGLAMVLCSLTSCIGTIGTAWATGFWSFAACRFITGFAFDNCINIPLILVMEYMAVNRRTLVINISFGIYFAIGSTLLPWLAYYVADWRYLAYIISISMGIGVFTPWILPESARWYASTGQWEKVVKNLKKIAKINGKNPDPRIYEIFVRNASNVDNCTQTATLIDLFKSPRLIKTTILMICFWTLTVMCFDGNVYSLKLLQSSIFVSFSLASATELPAGLLLALILDRWGRRFCAFFTVAAIGIFTLSEYYLPSAEAKLAVSVLGRFVGNMAANVGLQFSAEILPTPVRAQGVALIHLFGILAHAVAPYIIDLAKVWDGLPMVLIASLAFLAAILALFLPETLGKELPQTLQQGEDFNKNQKFWSFPCITKEFDRNIHNSYRLER